MLQNLYRISLVFSFLGRTTFFGGGVLFFFIPAPHFQAHGVLVNKSETLVWFNTSGEQNVSSLKKMDAPPVGGLLKGVKLYNH